MVQIKDLHVEKEIIPLFDYAVNEFSRSRLHELLLNPPGTLEEVLNRQRILLAILKQPHLLKNVSYARSELKEAFELTTRKDESNSLFKTHNLKLLSPFASKRSQQLLSKLHLLMSLLKRLQAGYFNNLDLDGFPTSFRHSLEQVNRVFDDLQVHPYDPRASKSTSANFSLLKSRQVLRDKVRNGEMTTLWESLFQFEAYLSIARGIRKNDFQFPTFTETQIKISGLYHPLLKIPVRNDIEIEAGVNLLSGPNMSGKSTFLRALGLCVYLAHVGLAVPAESCELKFFDYIFVSIDLHDDVQSGYSHFMTEIQNLKQVVIAAREAKTCFAVFDELFRGTNSDDALTISTVTINGFKKFTSSCFFVSTHLHGLQERIETDENISVRHIDCELIDGAPAFTYKLKDGWSQLKIGEILFEQAGLKTLLSGKKDSA